MAKTVIGVLQSAEQARQAVEELLKGGFEQQAVGVISADFAREAQAAIQGGSTGTAIGALVKKGIPEEQASFFAEGPRRGGALVTVLAKTDQDAARALEILKRHGAEKIDERIVQWRGLGWRGSLAAATRKAPKKAGEGASGVEPGVPFAAVEIYAVEIEIPEDAYAGPERRMNQGAYSGEERRQAA
ncbi:MAG TPA: hypothetical protein VF936_03960 [Burkholderiales bacterium]